MVAWNSNAKERIDRPVCRAGATAFATSIAHLTRAIHPVVYCEFDNLDPCDDIVNRNGGAGAKSL